MLGLERPPAGATRTLYLTFDKAARRTPEALAWDQSGWAIHYGEWLSQADALALGLLQLGTVPLGSPVGLLAENTGAWLIASLAVQALGAVEFPREADMSDAALEAYFLAVGCRICFVQDARLAQRVRSLALPWQSELRLIVLEPLPAGAEVEADLWTDVMDRGQTLLPAGRAQILERQSALTLDSIAVVLRSSGTTGAAKSVMLTHGNFLHNIDEVAKPAGLSASDRLLCCLPLWHLYGRLVAWIALAAGASLAFRPIETLGEALQEVRPTFFPSFPVVWIQVYHRLMTGVDARSAVVRALFWGCLAYSRLYYRQLYRARGQDRCLQRRSRVMAWRLRGLAALACVGLAIPQALIQRWVFRPIRAQLGGRMRAAIIGDAPLPPQIDLTLRALGLRVLEGYGSSEQMIVAMRGLHANAVGTVGQVLPQVELRLLDQQGWEAPRGKVGEIVVSGPSVFAGYYGEPERTREAFLQMDGRRWYRTGDLARLDFHGHLIVIGRKVARIPLPGDRTLYPELTESVLRATRYVAYAMVYPEPGGRLVALLVPEYGALYRYYCRHARCRDELAALRFPHEERALDAYLETQAGTVRRLLDSPECRGLMVRELSRFLQQAELPPHQVPTHVALSATLFVRGRELTPTLKLRRDEILARHAGRHPVFPLTL